MYIAIKYRTPNDFKCKKQWCAEMDQVRFHESNYRFLWE